VLELEKLAIVLSGVPLRETKEGRARMMRLSDVSDLKAGRTPILATGKVPDVARALTIIPGDLIVAARGLATDVLLASDAVFGAYVSLDLYLVRPDATKIDPHYLFAFLKLPATQSLFAAGKQGSGLTRLPKETLAKTKVPLPGMGVQRLIAALAFSFEEESRLFKKLSELNSVLGREVVARAFSAADTANPTRRKE
jgi:hypothetical protein